MGCLCLQAMLIKNKETICLLVKYSEGHSLPRKSGSSQTIPIYNPIGLAKLGGYFFKHILGVMTS